MIAETLPKVYPPIKDIWDILWEVKPLGVQVPLCFCCGLDFVVATERGGVNVMREVVFIGVAWVGLAVAFSC